MNGYIIPHILIFAKLIMQGALTGLTLLETSTV